MPADGLDAAPFAEHRDAAGQFADDFRLDVRPHLFEVECRLGEGQAELDRFLRFVDHFGGVEQSLARDAAAVQADAPELRALVDEDDLHAVVGRVQSRRVTARPPADDQQLRFAHVGHAWILRDKRYWDYRWRECAAQTVTANLYPVESQNREGLWFPSSPTPSGCTGSSVT